jgi:hypothetical protein
MRRPQEHTPKTKRQRHPCRNKALGTLLTLGKAHLQNPLTLPPSSHTHPHPPYSTFNRPQSSSTSCFELNLTHRILLFSAGAAGRLERGAVQVNRPARYDID